MNLISGQNPAAPNKDNVKNINKWGYIYPIEWKRLWEKQKLLVTSNCSFSHNVFKSCLLVMCQYEYLLSNRLTLAQASLGFCNTSPLKTLWEKEKLLMTSNFSFSHIVFHPLGELSAIFIKFKIVVCKHFQFGRVYNLSFGKGLS